LPVTATDLEICCFSEEYSVVA